jgi:hypothetical protein
MIRLTIAAIVAGIYFICSGCYDLFVQAGTSRQPTTVSIAELKTGVPGNRHLIITGGRADKENAVVFYKSKYGQKLSGSEIYFIPMVEAATNASGASAPAVLVRMTESQVNEARGGEKVSFASIEGIRTTSFDLEDKARQSLVQSYGQAAVDKMVILNYHGSIDIWKALGKLGGGVGLIGAVVGAFILKRKSD